MAKLILPVEGSNMALLDEGRMLNVEPMTESVPVPREAVPVTTVPSRENWNETFVTGVMENAGELAAPPANLRVNTLGVWLTAPILKVPLAIARPRKVSLGACESGPLALVKSS